MEIAEIAINKELIMSIDLLQLPEVKYYKANVQNDANIVLERHSNAGAAMQNE